MTARHTFIPCLASSTSNYSGLAQVGGLSTSHMAALLLIAQQGRQCPTIRLESQQPVSATLAACPQCHSRLVQATARPLCVVTGVVIHQAAPLHSKLTAAPVGTTRRYNSWQCAAAWWLACCCTAAVVAALATICCCGTAHDGRPPTPAVSAQSE